MFTAPPQVVLSHSLGIGFRLFAVWFLPVSLLGVLGYTTPSFTVVSSLCVGLVGFLGKVSEQATVRYKKE